MNFIRKIEIISKIHFHILCLDVHRLHEVVAFENKDLGYAYDCCWVWN